MKSEVSCTGPRVVQLKSKLPFCIHEVFEAQARKTPAAIALSFQQQAMTYSELDEQANQLAQFLVTQNIKAETPVALYLERTPRMVVAILAVLKAGATYVPIDLAYPPDRLAFMLEDTRAPILITEESLRCKLPAKVP